MRLDVQTADDIRSSNVTSDAPTEWFYVVGVSASPCPWRPLLYWQPPPARRSLVCASPRQVRYLGKLPGPVRQVAGLAGVHAGMAVAYHQAPSTKCSTHDGCQVQEHDVRRCLGLHHAHDAGGGDGSLTLKKLRSSPRYWGAIEVGS